MRNQVNNVYSILMHMQYVYIIMTVTNDGFCKSLFCSLISIKFDRLIELHVFYVSSKIQMNFEVPD